MRRAFSQKLTGGGGVVPSIQCNALGISIFKKLNIVNRT